MIKNILIIISMAIGSNYILAMNGGPIACQDENIPPDDMLFHVLSNDRQEFIKTYKSLKLMGYFKSRIFDVYSPENNITAFDVDIDAKSMNFIFAMAEAISLELENIDRRAEKFPLDRDHEIERVLIEFNRQHNIYFDQLKEYFKHLIFALKLDFELYRKAIKLAYAWNPFNISKEYLDMCSSDQHNNEVLLKLGREYGDLLEEFLRDKNFADRYYPYKPTYESFVIDDLNEAIIIKDEELISQILYDNFSLIDLGSKKGFYGFPLINAIKNSNRKIALDLVDKYKADVNVKESQENCPLFYVKSDALLYYSLRERGAVRNTDKPDHWFVEDCDDHLHQHCFCHDILCSAYLAGNEGRIEECICYGVRLKNNDYYKISVKDRAEYIKKFLPCFNHEREQVFGIWVYYDDLRYLKFDKVIAFNAKNFDGGVKPYCVKVINEEEQQLYSQLKEQGSADGLDCLIMPKNYYTAHGRIFMLMDSYRSTLEEIPFNILTDRQILELLLDIASGLQCLHACGIIHSDIKRSNILIEIGQDGLYHARIADFDYAIFVGAKAKGGTWDYRSPEHREKTEKITTASDIYSLGIVYWRTWFDWCENFSNELKIYTKNFSNDMLSYYIFTNQMPFNYCHKDMKDLIARCWFFEPSKRPQAYDIHEEIRRIIEEKRPWR